MFGQLIFSTIPYSTLDVEPKIDNKNYWKVVCPEVSAWETQDQDIKDKNECRSS